MWQEVVRACVSDEMVYGVSKRVEKGVVRAGGSSPSIMYYRLAS